MQDNSSEERKEEKICCGVCAGCSDASVGKIVDALVSLAKCSREGVQDALKDMNKNIAEIASMLREIEKKLHSIGEKLEEIAKSLSDLKEKLHSSSSSEHHQKSSSRVIAVAIGLVSLLILLMIMLRFGLLGFTFP